MTFGGRGSGYDSEKRRGSLDGDENSVDIDALEEVPDEDAVALGVHLQVSYHILSKLSYLSVYFIIVCT